MATSLKEKNRPWLGLVVLANVAGYLAALSNDLSVKGWLDILASAQELAPPLFVSILTGIINAQLNDINKARLVFWRYRNPLPGCRAFSKYMSSDPRIDRDGLKNHQDPLPVQPDEQNALWFRWYRECQAEAGVEQVHRAYLFTRDYAAISFLLVFGLGALALWQIRNLSVLCAYGLVLLAQYFMVRRAAYNHGTRFVTTVLAYKASRD